MLGVAPRVDVDELVHVDEPVAQRLWEEVGPRRRPLHRFDECRPARLHRPVEVVPPRLGEGVRRAAREPREARAVVRAEPGVGGEDERAGDRQRREDEEQVRDAREQIGDVRDRPREVADRRRGYGGPRGCGARRNAGHAA